MASTAGEPPPTARSRAVPFDRPLDTPPPPPRTITASYWLPDSAFGAAAAIDDLLHSPTVTFIPGRTEHRLILRPDHRLPTRARMSWMQHPGSATPTVEQLDHTTWTASDVARIDAWMRTLAARVHLLRAFIADAAERIMWDAADGIDESMPGDDEALEAGTLVSTSLITRVQPPTPTSGIGIVEVDWDSTQDDLMVFIDSDSQRIIGWRRTLGALPRPREVYTVSDQWPTVTPEDLMGWYEQHLYRERLYDAAFLAITASMGGLEPMQFHPK